jgi:hypothetical protein
MNRDDITKHLPILQAMAEGKQIQQQGTSGDYWYDVEDIYLSGNEVYRVAPEKLSFWINVYKRDGVFVTSIRESKEAANNTAGPGRLACLHIEGHEGDGL